MIMRDYCALPPLSRRDLLRTVTTHLADGGAFVLDVDSTAAFDEVREQASSAPSLMDGFWSDRPYFGFHNTFRYEHERVSLDKYEIVEADRARTFFNWIQYFTPDGLRTELERTGLADIEILGDVAGGRYEVGAPQFAAIARPARR